MQARTISAANESIRLMVCGYPRRAREVTSIMVLTALACMDDSGSEPSSFNCVIAGFVTVAPLWERFSDEWDAALKLDPPLEYFKMSEAESLKGQFLGWTAKQRDERIQLLVDIILRAEVLCIDIVMYWSDYRKVVQGKLPKEIDHPYFIGFHGVIAGIAEQRMTLGIENKIDVVFDKQGKLGDIAQAWYKLMHKNDAFKNVLKPYLGETPTFKDDKGFLPLQAADMFAWHVRRYYDSTLPENSAGPNLRPILRTFGRLPTLHRIITAENMEKIMEGQTYQESRRE